jgi:rhodanese-related sulfurtransferase
LKIDRKRLVLKKNQTVSRPSAGNPMQLFARSFAMDTEALSIQPSEFVQRFHSVHAPLILDVRRPAAFEASAVVMAGAQRCLPEQVAEFAAREPMREVVVYCVYGHNVGHDAAEQLRAQGWNARFLAGGLQGGEDGEDAVSDIAQWRKTALPTWRKRVDLGVTGDQPSRWVTRERPKIDRVACPWLIGRFIDPRAEFFYVHTDQVLAQAQQLGAIAYDIPNAPITHVVELCSFDALLAAFDMRWPALDLLARIVRGADTDNLQLEKPCAGLLAITQGMSRLHALDDKAMLAAMLPIYDALYAWCVDCVNRNVEPHIWATPAPLNEAALRRQAEQARQQQL